MSAQQPLSPEDEVEEEKKRAYATKRGRRKSISAECMGSGGGKAGKPYVPKVVAKTQNQYDSIHAAISKNFLFSSLSKRELDVVIKSMDEIKVSKGCSVIKEGDEGDYFYVVGETGSFETFVKSVGDGKQSVCTYKPGMAFGELALMYNAPRAATVTAVEDGQLWRVDRETFRHIILTSNSSRRKMYETFIREVPIISECLTSSERSHLADVLEQQNFTKGNIIVKEGDADLTSMKMYFVESGECKAITTNAQGDEVCVGVLTTGSYFGEKAILEKGSRACSVIVTSETCTCAAIDVASFERIFGPSKQMVKRMMERIESYTSAIDEDIVEEEHI